MARRVLVVALSLAVFVAACNGNEARQTRRRAARSSSSTSSSSPAPTSAPVPPAPPRAWVAIEGGRALAEVNLGSLTVERQVPVDAPPHNLVVADDGTVIATLQRAGTLAMLSPGATAVRVVALGGSPHDVKAAGDLLVVTNEAAARLDLVGLDGTRRGSIALPANPHDLALVPDGTAAWVSLDDSSDLAFVDLTTSAVRQVPTPIRPHDLRVATDGRVWVTKWGGGLARLSSDGTLEADLPIGEEVHHLAISADGTQVWASDNGGRQVLVVDAASARQIGSFALGGAPHHLALSGNRVAVADNTRGVVAVFDVTARAPVGEIPVGPGPHGAWAAP